jgi:hypothetical protein
MPVVLRDGTLIVSFVDGSYLADTDTFVASATGGDYFGLAAEADGRFRLVWAEVRNGISQLLTTTVAVRR